MPIPRGSGLGSTWVQNLGKPRPGSSSTLQVTGQSRRTLVLVSHPASTGTGSAAAVRHHDRASVRGALHRSEVYPGDVFVAHAGVPHYLGPLVSFIEVQEPSDLLVIAEAPEQEEAAATMGLGWDLALDMIDFAGQERTKTLAHARQEPRLVRTSHESRESRLFHDDVLEFFDATLLEVPDEIEIDDGRFCIAIVTSGEGSLSGNFAQVPVRQGETFAFPANLALRVVAGRAPVKIVRCFGPSVG